MRSSKAFSGLYPRLVGTLAFGMLLAVGLVGLLLRAVPRTHALGSCLTRVGLLGALGLLTLFVLLSLVTLPFD